MTSKRFGQILTNVLPERDYVAQNYINYSVQKYCTVVLFYTQLCYFCLLLCIDSLLSVVCVIFLNKCDTINVRSHEAVSLCSASSNLLAVVLAASALTWPTLGDSVTLTLSQLTPARPLNWHGIDFSCSLELVVVSSGTCRWTDGAGRCIERERCMGQSERHVFPALHQQQQPNAARTGDCSIS